jgi:bis(5'-nucleosidyl)-tetraphosphatase
MAGAGFSKAPFIVDLSERPPGKHSRTGRGQKGGVTPAGGIGDNAPVAARIETGKALPRRFSAGVVVARPGAEGWRYLLLRAFRNWDFPKGRVEPGEDPRQAALREVREESALTDLEFRWGEGWRETEPYAGGKVARYYVACAPAGKVSLPVNPELGHPEHHEFRWMNYGEARAMLAPRLQPVLDWARDLVEAGGGG